MLYSTLGEIEVEVGVELGNYSASCGNLPGADVPGKRSCLINILVKKDICVREKECHCVIYMKTLIPN